MFKIIQHHKRNNMFILFLLLLEAILFNYCTLLRTQTLNALVAKNFKSFIFWQLLIIGMWLFLLLTRKVSLVAREKLIQKQVKSLRLTILKKLEAEDFQTFHEREASEYLSWLTNDMVIVEDEGFREIYSGIFAFFMVLCSSLALLKMHPFLLITAFLLAVLLFFLPKLVKPLVKKSVKELSQTSEKANHTMENYLSGFDILYQQNKTQLLSQRLTKVFDEIITAKVQKANAFSWLKFLTDGSSISAQFIIIILNAWLIFRGSTTVGTVFSVGTLAGTLFNYLNEIITATTIATATEELFPKYRLLDKSIPFSAEETQKSFTFQNSLQLSQVSYSFTDKILKFPDFEIKAGEKYAIIGESGSGKSTLLNILTGRFKDYVGEILVDGQELKTLPSKIWNQQVAYVSPLNSLFPTTLLDNILLESPKQEDTLQTTLKLSEINFLENRKEALAKKYNLSTGQLQRVALARELYTRKKILFLDEATANLDAETARKVERNLLNQPDLTVIFVTHHLSPELQNKFQKIITL